MSRKNEEIKNFLKTEIKPGNTILIIMIIILIILFLIIKPFAK